MSVPLISVSDLERTYVTTGSEPASRVTSRPPEDQTR